MTHSIPEHVRLYLLTHADRSCRAQADHLGLKVSTVHTYRSVLRREGASLDPHVGSRRDVDTLDQVCDRIELGEHLPLVAQRLGIPYRSLVARVNRYGQRVGDLRARGGTIGLRALGQMFGYSHSGSWKAVQQWLGAGLIEAMPRRAFRGAAAKNAPWRFTVDAVIAFIDNPDAWHLFTPEQITDPDWRDYAIWSRDRAHLRPSRRATNAGQGGGSDTPARL